MFDRHFPEYRVWEASWSFFWGCTTPSDNLYAGYETISSGPERLLEVQFFGKETVNFPVNKKFWLSYSRTIECDKLLGTFLGGQKVNLKITVEDIRSLL